MSLSSTELSMKRWLAEPAMEPIDRRFRFSRDFCVVWALLAVPVFFFLRERDVGPWYSEGAFLIVVPLFATFVLYGPVALVRQVIGSGSRGLFVAPVFVSIVVTAALLLCGLLISGFYSESRARAIAFVFTGAATVYLNWRLERNR